jgi:signal transduction histidine kinase
MPPNTFPRLVSLACHDLRTPLATIYGFARTLTRAGELDERSARFIAMIEEASEQMTALLDELGTAARIEGARWEPALAPVTTLELARSEDERVAVAGTGALVETDADAVRHALGSLAQAALRHGPVDEVTWTVDGRMLALTPVTSGAGPVLLGAEPKDLGSLVAGLVLRRLGGSVELDGETLRVGI